jgi:hypothetical protein
MYDQFKGPSRKVVLQVHAACRGVNQRIACGFHLCKHALGKGGHELCRILAERLARVDTPSNDAPMIKFCKCDVIRRCSGHLLSGNGLTEIGLHSDQGP